MFRISFFAFLFLLYSAILSDEISFVDGVNEKGKVTKVSDNSISFIKNGNKNEVCISTSLLNFYVMNGDTTKIERPAVDTVLLRKFKEAEAEKTIENLVRDSVKNARQDSLLSVEYTRQLIKLDKVSHSAFLSWTITLPILPLGHIYNKEYSKALWLGLGQLALSAGALSSYKNNGALFMASGLGLAGVFVYTKLDSFNSSVRYNRALASEYGIVLPRDYHFTDFLLCLATCVITFPF